MIRIHYFNFIISKFLQMSKLLCNVLKISGGQMPSPPIARLLARFNRRRRMKAENRQIPQKLAARLKFVCCTDLSCMVCRHYCDFTLNNFTKKQ